MFLTKWIIYAVMIAEGGKNVNAVFKSQIIMRRLKSMRKDLGKKLAVLPAPVLMIGTYDANGKANVMNAVWGGVHDTGEIFISLGKHKTTDNLELKKAFTVGFATKETEKISDYFGLVSGNNEDKIAKAGVHVVKSNFIDAPIIEEYPLTIECNVKSFANGELIGEIVNVSVDEKYIDEDGNIDVEKMNIIAFDMVNNHYRVLGEVVGNAFKDGLEIKNQ